MTVNELSQLYYLNEEIKKNRRKLQELRSRRGLHSQVIDDMPHGDGPRRSKDEDLTAMIIDLEEVIKARLVLAQKERIRLERYIMTIPDSLTRQIFEDRFVSLMSWDEVSVDIGGDYTIKPEKPRRWRMSINPHSQVKTTTAGHRDSERGMI